MLFASSQVTVTSTSLGTHTLKVSVTSRLYFLVVHYWPPVRDYLDKADTVAVLRTMDFQRETRRETSEEMPLNLALIIRLNLENLGKMPDTQKELGGGSLSLAFVMETDLPHIYSTLNFSPSGTGYMG